MEKCKRCGMPWIVNPSEHTCKESNEYQGVSRENELHITPTDTVRVEHHEDYSEFTIKGYYGATSINEIEAKKLALFILKELEDWEYSN